MSVKSLKETFSEVSAELYQKCDVVFSAPTCFFWAGDNLVQYGIPAVTQKLPVRVYVGLEKSNSKALEYGTCKAYDPKKNTFVDVNVEISVKTAIDWLNDFLREEQVNVSSGSRIHFVIEHMVGSGNPHAAVTLGAVASSLAACIVCRYTDVAASQLSASCVCASGPAFERVFRLAWALTAVMGGGTAPGNGADVFCALVSSSFPQLFVPRPCSRIPEEHTKIDANASVMKGMPYCGVSISDITGSAPEGAWPFDFGLLYSGVPKRILEAVRFSQHWKSFWTSSLDSIVSRCGKTLDVNIDSHRWRSLVSVRDGTRRADELWEIYLDLAAMLSLNLFAALVNLFEQRPWSDEMRHFVTCVNESALYGRPCEPRSPWMDHLCYRMSYWIFRRFGTLIGVKSAGPGSGGGLLFVAPCGILRNELQPLVEEFRAQSDLDVRVEYTSWIDGYEEDGLIVEQNVEENILAPSAKKGYLGVKLWKGHGVPEAVVLPEAELSALTRRYDLVADVKDGAVYVAGEQIKTQHGLRSAIYTCELLSRLLAEPTLEIAADKMPHRSYALERSELQGKIIGPLTRIIQERTGKTLKLTVKTTRGIVSLQLCPCDVNLCVVT